MSQTPSQPPPHQDLDAYLDGVLVAKDRERFESAMRADPALAEQVRLQRRIDDSLGRLFADAPAAVGEPPSAPRRILFRPVIWSIAAVVVVAATLAAYFFAFPRAPKGPSPLATLYQVQLDSHFVPEKVCTTVPEFAQWLQQYFGQPLYPPENHTGVEFVGWNYGPAISSNSGVLLARVNGKEVIVVVDRLTAEKRKGRQLQSDLGPGLKAFRKEFPPFLVLYEVTPLDQPAILPLLSAKPQDGK